MNFHLFHSFGLLRMIQPTPFFFSNIICSSRVIVFWKHGYFYYVLIYSTTVTLCMIEGVKIYSNFNYEQCACHLES